MLAVKAKTLSEFKAGMKGIGIEAFRIRVKDAVDTKKEPRGDRPHQTRSERSYCSIARYRDYEPVVRLVWTIDPAACLG